ncbi:MAG: hypothetical protein IPK34_17245 [Ramlibacter sp.]|nr:hypothetical protein [Ramlibacter sp.]
MSFLKFAIGLSIALLGLGAAAQRMPVPIIDHDKVPVAVAPGKTASPASVKEAIIAAAKNKALGGHRTILRQAGCHLCMCAASIRW